MTLFLITAPSGSGKTTLANFVGNYWKECVSHTTRPMREGEVNGVTYYFGNKEEFEMIDMLETVTYDGNLYGLSKKEVNHVMKQNKHAYVIVEHDGYKQIKEKFPEAVGIFLYMSKEDCLANMLLRGDSVEKATGRLGLYDNEIKNRNDYDYVIKNVRGHLLQTANILKSIIGQYY